MNGKGIQELNLALEIAERIQDNEGRLYSQDFIKEYEKTTGTRPNTQVLISIAEHKIKIQNKLNKGKNTADPQPAKKTKGV